VGVNAGNLTMGSGATQTYHGSYNTGVGRAALGSNTTGYSNSALGLYALLFNTTGHSNSALGVNAGRFIADGSTANETSNTSLYLGADTKASADGRANEIVIGYNAIGAGSNTVVLGNSSITATTLRGAVSAGTSITTSGGITLGSTLLTEANLISLLALL
jgi:hypothetical protein